MMWLLWNKDLGTRNSHYVGLFRISIYAIEDIRIFDSWEAFYKETGWERDNPECADKGYLMNERICREILFTR